MQLSKKEFENRLKILFDRLEIYRLFPEEFREKFGVKGGQEEINRTLDEIIFIKRQLAKIQSEENE